jgi:hypothetical protein
MLLAVITQSSGGSAFLTTLKLFLEAIVTRGMNKIRITGTLHFNSVTPKLGVENVLFLKTNSTSDLLNISWYHFDNLLWSNKEGKILLNELHQSSIWAMYHQIMV